MIGAYHHRQYKARSKEDLTIPSQSKLPLRSIHRWFGRFLIVLAMINGGLGVAFGDNTPGGEKVYGVIAGIVGVTYIVTLVFWYLGPKGESQISQLEVVDNDTTKNDYVVEEQTVKGNKE
jgi:hypothetical protein